MKSPMATTILLVAASPMLANSLLFISEAERLQPQVVAQSLAKMEDEWRTQAELFAECNATLMSNGKPPPSCNGAIKAFEKSCSTVVSAVQRASNGDRSVVTEYMGDVCGQNVLQGWRKERCQGLASTITGFMTADNYQNRMSLNVASLCEKYWSAFAAAETARVTRERADAEAKRVAREAEEKKLAEERAEEAKKAAEAAAKLEKQRKTEEAARKEAEEKRKAEELKKKAEEEAAELKAKEEEALRKAEEAKRKMDQAKTVAEEARKKREATVVKANATATVNSTAIAKPVAKETAAKHSAVVPSKEKLAAK